jgi:hypothetical protein
MSQENVSKHQVLAERVCGRVLGPLHIHTAAVGVQRDRTRGEDVHDAGRLRVGGDHRHTEQPLASRIVRKTHVLNRIRG